MFGRKRVIESIGSGTAAACQDYFKRIIEGAPSSDSLEDRALYLANAYNQARGMEHLAKFLAGAIDDNTLLIPINGLLGDVEKMIEFNMQKLDSETA